MANSAIELEIHGRDPIIVTFADGTTLTGDFLRWFPRSDGISFAFSAPQAAADLAAITSVYYVDSYRHVQKLTPTDP